MQHQSQTSSLLKLPTEVLHQILSYVLAKPYYHFDDEDDDSDYEDDDDFDDRQVTNEELNRCDDSQVRNSPVLTVRSVCQIFRSIAAELPFWWEDEKFDLLSSLKPASQSDVEEAKFLSVLFEDPRIIQSLTKRKHWHIHDVQCLELIMEKIPSFSENTTSVTINQLIRDDHRRSATQQYGLQWLDIVIGHLATCQHIRSLELGPVGRQLILKAKIAEFWPTLETLTVWLPFRGVGMLDGLTQLRTVKLRAEEMAQSGSSFLLPMESAATLTYLHIGLWPPGRNYSANSLNALVNLTTFQISSLTDDIRNFLLRYTGDLRTFSTRSYRSSTVTPREVASTFSAPCLQTVERFTFGYDLETDDGLLYLLENENDLGRLEPIVEAITKITSIQILRLNMPVDGRWYRHFHRLSNLKELKWKAVDDERLNLYHESFGFLDEKDRHWSTSDFKLARKIFSEAFVGYPQVPKIEFIFRYRRNVPFEEPPEEDPVDLGHDRAWGGYDIYQDEEYWNNRFGLNGGWSEEEWEDDIF